MPSAPPACLQTNGYRTQWARTRWCSSIISTLCCTGGFGDSFALIRPVGLFCVVRGILQGRDGRFAEAPDLVVDLDRLGYATEPGQRGASLELQSAVFEYIEASYNRERRHSTLNMLSPVNYEQQRLSPTTQS
jgi:transposase InsO family protein